MGRKKAKANYRRIAQNGLKRRRESASCAIAFHEKAGLSQEIFLCRVRHCRHPSIRSRCEHFARCKLGVLVSAGAAT
jgi:hypothetical protein